MITVILIMVPLTVPKAFGVRIYGVLTGSMTPAYSVGGVVYVMEENPLEIQVGDVITYSLGSNTEYVMTHRVIEIVDGNFITKGDANNTADPEPVSPQRVIGKVVYFLPGMAGVAEFVNSVTGRSIFIMLFALSFILWVIADMIYPSERKVKKADNELQNKEKIRSKGRKSGRLWQFLGIVLMAGAIGYLAYVYLGYHESESEYAGLEQEIFGKKEEITQTLVSDGQEETQQQAAAFSKEDKQIVEGIAKLHEENADVIGWIRFDNMDISYPIMQGSDNDFYLNHTYSGEENSSGSIFMEASNSSDFEDSHTIIYGHNMKNRSMFGSLKDYKEKDHYQNNTYFSIYTLNDVYRYQIFAYYDISMYGDVYNNQFGADDYFQSFIDSMVSRSYYDTGIEPDKNDKIITLSTCSTEGNRFVVNAVRVFE